MNTTKYNVLYALKVTQPIAEKSFKHIGRIIHHVTIDEDFAGIDFKIENPNTHVISNIDVKCSKKENWSSPNFLYTTVDGNGKSYKHKKTDYVAFLDFNKDKNKNEIVIISFIEIQKLISNCIEIPSKYNTLGKYVLIDKTLVRNNGYEIDLIM